MILNVSFRLEKQPETNLHPHFYNISTVKMLIKNVVKMLLRVGVNKFPVAFLCHLIFTAACASIP